MGLYDCGVSKSEICWAGGSGRSWCCSAKEEFLFCRETIDFWLLRPFTDCMKPTQIIEDNLLYLKSTDHRC